MQSQGHTSRSCDSAAGDLAVLQTTVLSDVAYLNYLQLKFQFYR